jgi:hypothetical protein
MLTAHLATCPKPPPRPFDPEELVPWEPEAT